MGYFIIKSGEKIIEGDMSMPTVEVEPEQKEAMAFVQKNQHHVNTPFLVILISYTPGDEIPYQITHISPDFYACYSFDENDFVRYVRDLDEHRENICKLVYVQEGELFQRVESQRHRYFAGSCFLLNRNVSHSEEYLTPFRTISLFLSEKFFRELILEDERYFLSRSLWNTESELHHFFEAELYRESTEKKNYIDFIPRNTSTREDDPLRPLFEELVQIIRFPSPGCLFHFKYVICRIFSQLSNVSHYTTVPLELGSEAEGRLFSQITALLEKYNGHISRKQLSQELNYSGCYLNRTVNKYTGLSISQYATTFAMRRAAWLLLHSDTSISEIIMELGYSNRTSFYKAFEKIYGETPLRYRARNRNEMK